jgi:DNA-binding MarR family transcriptional regulator
LKSIDDMRIGALLRTAYQEVAKIINCKIEAAGYEDIRTTHTPVLQPLYFSPLGLTSTELADLAGMTKQSMGELVKYLEKQGYIERKRSQKDLRAWLILLTPKGNELVEKLYHIVSEIDEELADRFGIERFKDLRIKLMEFIPIVQIKSRG